MSTRPPTPTSAGAPGSTDITVESKGSDVYVTIQTRCYRVRGLGKNMSSQQMKVNIMVTRDELVYMDTFDLCKAQITCVVH